MLALMRDPQVPIDARLDMAAAASADIISVLSCIGQRFAHIGIEARDAAPCASRYPGPGPIGPSDASRFRYRKACDASHLGYVVTVMRHKR